MSFEQNSETPLVHVTWHGGDIFNIVLFLLLYILTAFRSKLAVKSGRFLIRSSNCIYFVICCIVRFWLGTAVALAAINTIPRWVKEKVVQGCMLFITFLGHLVFLVSISHSEVERFDLNIAGTPVRCIYIIL